MPARRRSKPPTKKKPKKKPKKAKATFKYGREPIKIKRGATVIEIAEKHPELTVYFEKLKKAKKAKKGKGFPAWAK